MVNLLLAIAFAKRYH